MNNVLITRPQPQADVLAQKLNALGYHTLLFPAIEIIPYPDTSSLQQMLAALNHCSLAIFISQNAVLHSIKAVLTRYPELSTFLRVACVGPATKRLLEQYQIAHIISPKSQINSEGLLALPSLHDVNGKHIAIFRGQGGNMLLAETLQQRGAIVHEAVVYQRQKPMPTRLPSAIFEQDVIISTSKEGLKNFHELLQDLDGLALLTTPLLVISSAMVELSKALGFTQILLADNATDEAVINAIKTL